MSDEDVWRSQFEQIGVNQVRGGFGSYPAGCSRFAIKWLAEQDAAAELAEEASKREQISLAREAADSARLSADAARTSNKIAMAALAVAIIAVMISVISIVSHP